MIKIYKNYKEFSQREDKTINGVSQDFLNYAGITLDKLNLINCEDCWNCRNCKDCWYCQDCCDCEECTNCTNCTNCRDCYGLTNRIYCTNRITNK